MLFTVFPSTPFSCVTQVRSSPVIRPSPEAVLENIPPFTKNKVASPTDSNNSSSTPSVESPLVSKDAVEVAKSLNVKQALSSNQLSYAKAVMQIAVTSQSSKLETDKSPSSKLSTLSSAVTRTIPTLTTPSIGSSVSIQVKPATPLGVLKLATSVAPKPVQTDVTTASTAPISTSISVGKKDLDAVLVTLNSRNKVQKYPSLYHLQSGFHLGGYWGGVQTPHSRSMGKDIPL